MNIFSLKKNYDSAIVGFIGAFLIFLFTKHSGIGLEPDSIVYLSAARSAALGHGFYEFEGIPLTDFPVGYPAFLSIILFITHVDILQSGHIINMVLYFTLIYLSGCLINELSPKNKWVKILSLLMIALSPVLLGIYTMLMSESLFLLMILMFYVALHQYGQKKTINTLLLVSIIAGLSCIVRYAGVTLLATGGLMILLDKKLKPNKKVGHVFIYGAIGISFLVGNIVRNYLVFTMLTGPRESSITPLFENIKNYAIVLADFFKFGYLPSILVLIIGILFFIFYVFTFVFQTIKSEKYYNYLNIIVLYFVIYSIFIILTATYSRFDSLDARLLSPLFISGLLPLVFVVDRLILKFNGWKKYSLVLVFVLIFGMTSYFQFKDNEIFYKDSQESGIPGYAEDYWKNSEIFKYIKDNKQRFNNNTKIYSDGNEVVYLFTGFKAHLIPHNEYESEIVKFNDNQKIDYYIVWFYDNIDPELFSLNKLLKDYKLILLKSSLEGRLYYHQGSTDSKNQK